MRGHAVLGSSHAGFERRDSAQRPGGVRGASAAARARDSASLRSRLVGLVFIGAVRERWRRARQRAMADEWLAWGATPQEQSQLLAPRADELTSAKSRRALARVCRRYVAEIRDPPCRAYAVNRAALREHVGSLARLGVRLADLSKPVSAHSILLAREVVDGNGPLFNRGRANELGPALKRALRALDEDEALPRA
jgi:hypothetical protein